MILVRIQVAKGKTILAKEEVKPYRKDVTQKLVRCCFLRSCRPFALIRFLSPQYGGDVTRRMKLLEQQARGKKRMRMIGKVQVPREVFVNVLKQN